ncbi:hypothetical protein [Streptomyces sp. NPDC002994]|uniref:hypothetical protein n=1 Tax=Streptomyces sp. NPDC002994 TaxID=3154441 RepID=UPI0033A11104
MADSNGLRVDLSALDEVIAKLRQLITDMDKTGEKAKYSTSIPLSAFGMAGGTDADTGDAIDFAEARELHNAHEDMKLNLERIIKKLNSLIDKFGTDTSKVRNKYADQEHAVKQHMGGGSGKGDMA